MSVTGKDACSRTVTATRDGDQRLGIPSAGSVLTGSNPDLIRVTDLVADAQRRGSDADPGSAFFGCLARLADEGAAKRDTSDAITVPGALRSDIHDALAVVLAPRPPARCVPASPPRISSPCGKACWWP
jgi:hypothetical protein